jgi:hypothetical protein
VLEDSEGTTTGPANRAESESCVFQVKAGSRFS